MPGCLPLILLLLQLMQFLGGQFPPLAGCQVRVQGHTADGFPVQGVDPGTVNAEHPLDLVVDPLAQRDPHNLSFA